MSDSKSLLIISKTSKATQNIENNNNPKVTFVDTLDEPEELCSPNEKPEDQEAPFIGLYKKAKAIGIRPMMDGM